MSDSADTPTRRMIFTADVEHYSRKTTWSQIDIQQDLVDVISDAARAVGLDRGRWLPQGQGDAELALLPPGTDEALVLADLTRALGERLRRRNHDRASHGRMRLRVALHTGITHVGANGFPGKAPVLACRLRDSDPLRAALAAVPQAQLALIIPANLYEELVVPEYRGLRPADFRKVRIQNKELTTYAYICVPGYPVEQWAPNGGPRETAGRSRRRRTGERPSGGDHANATGGGDAVIGTKHQNTAGRDYYEGTGA